MYIQTKEDIMLEEALSIETLLESEGFEFLNEHKEVFMKFLNEDGVAIVLNESDIAEINKSLGKYIKDTKAFLDNAKTHADSVNPYTALNRAIMGMGLLSLLGAFLGLVGADSEAGAFFMILAFIGALITMFMVGVSSSENARRYKVTSQHMNSLKTMRRKLLTFKAKTTNMKIESDIDSAVANIDEFITKWALYATMDEQERAEYNERWMKERDIRAKEAIARNTANPTVVIVRESGDILHSF